jgi:outer membrane protein assembly factor BamB
LCPAPWYNSDLLKARLVETHEETKSMRRLPCALLLFCCASAHAADWTQFRGPNASGVADGTPLPGEIGPDKNVLWKVPLPPGHSSPVVSGDRIFVTAVRDKKLFVIGLDRRNGKTLWEREIPHKGLEKIHQVGSHCQSSPATDGQVVVTFFGSSGLFCHDRDGKLLWSKPFGPFNNEFGAGSSPVLVGDRVLLVQDHDTESFVMALDRKTGEVAWKTERSEFPRNYATPVVWEVDGKKQVVVVGTLRVIGYDLDSGKELWTVRGLSRIVNMTPVAAPDGNLYVVGWTAGADPEDLITPPAWEDYLKANDKNKNGGIEEKEMPEAALKQRFLHFDRNKDGSIVQEEWAWMRDIFVGAKNVALAVKPGGKGDITKTHVLWRYSKNLPYIPSPLYYQGLVYLMKNGGILTTLDARNGEPTKSERVYGTANYYASPIAGDGKVYTVSQKGECSVIQAGAQWKVLSRARFGDEVFATPAIADGQVFVRTAEYLYCFEKK